MQKGYIDNEKEKIKEYNNMEKKMVIDVLKEGIKITAIGLDNDDMIQVTNAFMKTMAKNMGYDNVAEFTKQIYNTYLLKELVDDGTIKMEQISEYKKGETK